MRQSSLSIILALLVATFGVVGAQVTLAYVKQSEGVLRGALERKQIEDLEIMYKEAFILKSLDGQKLESMSQPLCALLQLSNPEVTSLQAALYLEKFRNILSSSCLLSSQQKTISSTLQKESESIQTAEQVFKVVSLAAELNQTSILRTACGVAPNYLQSDGTARAQLSDPNSSNYFSAGQIVDAIQICIQTQILSLETLKKQLDIALESILLNSVLIEPKKRAVMHNMQTLELTAKITQLFTSFPNKSLAAFASFESTYKNTLLGFLKSEANSSLLSTNEKFEIVALQQADLSAGVIVASKSAYNLKARTNVVLLRFENLLGEHIKIEKNITASLFLRTQKVVESLIVKPSTDEKFPFALNISSSAITKPGFHSLRISIEGEEVLDERILFTTTVSLKQVEFEATQGKGKIPKKYTHSLTYKQLNSNSSQVEKIIGNQNSFLYVQFSLEFVKQQLAFTPSQVAVRLRHPTFTGVTHLVEAEYDDIQNVYLAIVDFGDPLTILPYSATYNVELIVADQRLTNQIQKTIAQFDATFKTARNGKTPPNDADFIIPKPIDHVVVDTIQSPPMPFVLAFIFMMAVSLLAYLMLIHRIQLNTLRIKNLTGIQHLYVILFAVSLIGSFGLLVAFWVKINLLQTVTYISIGIVPFILIGNAALNSLSQPENRNDAQQDSD